MIYWKLIVTDQSYEVSCTDINFVPRPMRFSCPTQGWHRENKYIRENWGVKMFAVAGYHAVVCDAFILIWNGNTLNQPCELIRQTMVCRLSKLLHVVKKKYCCLWVVDLIKKNMGYRKTMKWVILGGRVKWKLFIIGSGVEKKVPSQGGMRTFLEQP